MLSVEKLACTHGDSHYLFDEVTFSLNPGERILISGYSGGVVRVHWLFYYQG